MSSSDNDTSRIVPCPLCGCGEFQLRYPATTPRDGTLVPQDFRCTSHGLGRHGDIVRCIRCGMLYNQPQPDPRSLLDIYRDIEDPTYVLESGARELTFARSLGQLHRYRRPPGRLLDVGCYTGVFMEAAAAAGWDVDGAELSGWAASVARGRGLGAVYEAPLEQLQVADSSYQVLTLWDVIEHVPEPRPLIAAAYRLLEPGGVLAFSTHLVDSLAVAILGTRYPFFMDMHLVHFSRRTVRQLLTQQGFEVAAIRPHRRILRTRYLLEKLGHASGMAPVRMLLGWLGERSWLGRRHVAVGLLGLANIFARKP